MTPAKPDGLPQAVQTSLFRFMQAFEDLRPALYRYCRCLTRSPWDAEDLVQDALGRAFVTLGRMGTPPPNPRAWLFRVASNLWIDQKRRVPANPPPEPAVTPVEPRDQREAAGTLIATLAPRERVAVVLKDVFDFELDEIAEVLGTTTGTVKTTLHRGRGKLADPEATAPREEGATVPAVLDAFCAAFNAQDLGRLTALLLDTSTVEIVGTHTDFGPEDAARNAFPGMLYGAARIADGTGVAPRFTQGALAQSPRCEVRFHRGEPLLLLWYAHADGEAVRSFNRVEVEGEHVVALKAYFYTPEAIAELCQEMNVPFRINGYRHCLSVD